MIVIVFLFSIVEGNAYKTKRMPQEEKHPRGARPNTYRERRTKTSSVWSEIQADRLAGWGEVRGGWYWSTLFAGI
jgi:hypothetical protein